MSGTAMQAPGALGQMRPLGSTGIQVSAVGIGTCDYLEKASTKATGRALAALGYGTSFATELDEEERIVDSPVEQRPAPVQRAAKPEGPSGALEEGEAPANEQQLESIRKLCAALGREEPAPEGLTFASASALIRQLSKEFNNQRRAG